MSVEVLTYRYIGGEEENPEDSSTSARQFELYVRDTRTRAEDEYFWINAELAGSLWPLAVVDFYMDHLVIQSLREQEEEEVENLNQEDSDDQESDEEDDTSEDGDDIIIDYLYKGERLLQSGFKVRDISFTFDILNAREDEEEVGSSECLEALGQLTVGMSEDVLKDNTAEENGSNTEQGTGDNSQEKDAYEDETTTSSVWDEEEFERILLFYVEMVPSEASLEDKEEEEAILQLEDLRIAAPKVLLKFLESKLKLQTEDSEVDPAVEDLGTI